MKPLLASCLLLAGAFLARSAEVTIPIEQYQLKNGLRVVLSPDNAVPVVTVYLMYNVGSRSEEKGRTGFAHLFEHMMFEGSANAPKGMHFATIESNGGVMNGSTHRFHRLLRSPALQQTGDGPLAGVGPHAQSRH